MKSSATPASPPGINLSGVFIVVGNYGSGKTEICINLAVNQKRAGIDVCIADLDLVNPYFRTREAKNTLATLGIEVILPSQEYLQADLPVLSPLVAGIIRKPMQFGVERYQDIKGLQHDFFRYN